MELSRDQAASALAHADRSAARVRTQTRWFVRYLAVFAAGFGVLTLVLGLVQPLWLRLTISMALWIPLVAGMAWWAQRQRATAGGAIRRTVPGWIGTGALYAAALFVGTPGQLGNPAYWVPAAVVVTLPLAVVAWRESRR
ncbi:hypothetical protein [Pseudonocardia sp.]|uniref:hypothetical protein n=1 Tax=Pseudonocardia sp. TaxID=60912 RepID=UPI00261BB8FF|nr:hypothetical protein [Pseudonocardia sp.]